MSTDTKPAIAFSAQDKADILERYRDDDVLVIGGKAYPVRPLNGVAALSLMGLLRSAAASIGKAAEGMRDEQQVTGGDIVAAVVTAATEQFDSLIDLILAVLKRATPSLTREELLENMDFVEDLERFWEIFSRQNKVDLLLKKARALIGPQWAKIQAAAQAKSSGSSDSRTTSAGTTAGPPTSSLGEVKGATATTN